MFINVIKRKVNNGFKYIVDTTKYKCQCMLQKNMLSRDKRYVFMFHNVTDNEEMLECDEYSISSKKIMQIIEQLREEGYKIVSPKDIITGKGKKVLLTFDDAYSGVYTKMFSLFVKSKVPFTVFQTTDFIGKEKYLSDNMINEMLKYRGFTLGAHTATHCTLANLNKETLEKEIVDSKNILEEKYNTKISCLAYPYGDFVSINHHCIDIARENFDMAFSTIQCGVKKKYRIGLGKYIIPRINFNENNALQIIDSLLQK